jgi:hypothetical protein
VVGKRSNFERREADFYPTPRAAVVPLVPYLRGIHSFAEPCAGDGTLIRHLESFDLRCVYSGDIRTGQDALAVDSYGPIDAIITNPPYSRDVLHKLISHFQGISVTWLLLPTDFVSTLQAVPFLSHCSDIVPIGRVKWFADSKYSSKDNFGWYRFDARHKGATAIRRRRDSSDNIRPIRPARMCEQCCKPYEPQRSSSRFCSETCRQRAHRHKVSVTVNVTPALSEEIFRYVRHADVQKFAAEGWELLPALDGTHHGEYSALMRRRFERD